MKPIVFLPLVGLLYGCGTENDTAPTVKESEVKLAMLSQTSSEEVSQHLKNGLYHLSINSSVYPSSGELVPDAAPAPALDESSDASSGFSETITQEIGVDEGDRIKYDGDYLYIAKDLSTYQAPDELWQSADTEQISSIRIFQRESSSGELSELSEFKLPDTTTQINSIYQENQTLAVLGDNSNFYQSPQDSSTVCTDDKSSLYENSPNNASGRALSSASGRALSSASSKTSPVLPYYYQQCFSVNLIDITSKSSPKIKESYAVDGKVINSRRIDNTLYLFSRYNPKINGLPYAETDEEKNENYEYIQSLDTDLLLPKIKNSQGEISSLVDLENCYLPSNASDEDGHSEITTITAIDLTAPAKVNSICVNAQIQDIYVSSDNIYLYASKYETNEDNSEDYQESTVIHKFSLNKSNIDYQSSGVIPGRIGWGLSNLRFSEQEGFLRILTTQGDSWRSEGFEHILHILNDSDGELKLIAQLPNEQAPTPIGKAENGRVFEDVYAVRYFDNLAYVVTFEQTDPLYVLDLSDNTAPTMAGALEIPGFSTYLHPLSQDLLVGIGRSTGGLFLESVMEEFPDDEPTTDPNAFGTKLSLFDISDITQPKEINAFTFTDGSSEASYNYHALTYLKQTDGSHRFALPIYRWGYVMVTDDTDGDITQRQQRNSLELITVTANDNTAELRYDGAVKNSISEHNRYYSQMRSVLHFDDIYFVTGHDVWRSYWSNPKNTTGPF